MKEKKLHDLTEKSVSDARKCRSWNALAEQLSEEGVQTKKAYPKARISWAVATTVVVVITLSVLLGIGVGKITEEPYYAYEGKFDGQVMQDSLAQVNDKYDLGIKVPELGDGYVEKYVTLYSDYSGFEYVCWELEDASTGTVIECNIGIDYNEILIDIKYMCKQRMFVGKTEVLYATTSQLDYACFEVRGAYYVIVFDYAPDDYLKQFVPYFIQKINDAV